MTIHTTMLRIKNTHDYTQDESYNYEPLSGPLASDNGFEKRLAAISGLDRGTIRGKLDAEEQIQIADRMNNPTKFSYTDDKKTIVRSAIHNVMKDILSAPKAGDKVENKDDSEPESLDDWDSLTEYSNTVEPTDETDDDIAAGDVNGSEDMVNQSLETINKIGDEQNTETENEEETEKMDESLPEESDESNKEPSENEGEF